ncbi:MAG: hypothetical protein V3V41_07955 [Candidatus Heimdallarchaeota archaeon]
MTRADINYGSDLYPIRNSSLCIDCNEWQGIIWEEIRSINWIVNHRTKFKTIPFFQ